MIAAAAIQRFFYKLVIALALTREFKTDLSNIAFWTGKWYSMGWHSMSQPAREYVCKITELGMFAGDFVLGHLILFSMLPIIAVPPPSGEWSPIEPVRGYVLGRICSESDDCLRRRKEGSLPLQVCSGGGRAGGRPGDLHRFKVLGIWRARSPARPPSIVTRNAAVTTIRRIDRLPDIRIFAIWATLAIFTTCSAYVLFDTWRTLPLGFDFSALWTGARVALEHPARLYDFAYVLGEHARLIGDNHIGPFIYPPSALWVLAPFGLLSFPLAYGLWLLLTGGLFVWAAMRAGAKGWFLLFPPIMLVAAPGQTSFLVGGLVIAGLALRRRERIAGALFGLAAAFKPQLLVLLPLALVADGRWRTIFYSGLIGLSVCLTSAVILGPGSWIEWLKAVPRFQHIFFTTLSVTRAVTPYAWLVSKGASGAWAYLLVPPVAVGVWMTFRKTGRLAERMLALFGGTLLIIPYAMNYELALLVPAAAVFSLASKTIAGPPASRRRSCLASDTPSARPLWWPESPFSPGRPSEPNARAWP